MDEDLKRIVERAKKGERFVAIYPCILSAKEALKSCKELGCIIYLHSMSACYGTKGLILFRHSDIDPDRLRGLVAEVMFFEDAYLRASADLTDIAAERTAVYRNRQGTIFDSRLDQEEVVHKPTPDFKGFANQLLSIAREGGDADGADIQEYGVKFGLLEMIEVTEPCRDEGCLCGELGEFPTDCFRKTY